MRSSPTDQVRGGWTAAGTAALAAVLALALGLPRTFAAGNPGPGPTEPADLPQTLEEVPITILELTWDFGDPEPPDWRKELVGEDPTAGFRLRWKYTGPTIAAAVLSLYDRYNAFLGDVALPLAPPDADGYRYLTLQIGDLPGVPTMTMHVRLKDGLGEQIGCASNEVQITKPDPADPFLYTPLFMIGLATDFGVPGIAGAVSCNKFMAPPDDLVFFDGVRRFDGGAGAIAATDRWHIGSCTKAMTCTLMGVLIQSGMLLPGGSATVQWDTPLSEVFPEWSADMHSRFDVTTLRHLACHRSGLRMTKVEDAETRVVGGANDDPRQFRRDMTERLLTRQHYELDDNHDETTVPTTVGTDFFYGSGNYLVLGAVIEQLTGTSFEEAIQQWLFAPLDMSSAAFGMPSDQRIYQPHGHYRDPDFPHDIRRDNTACPPVWNPAGSAYLRMEDWLKFLRLHLNATEGNLTLNAATLAELHTPYPKQSGGDTSYGFGWSIRWEPGGQVLDHNGHYFRFYARCRVHTGYRFVACAASNIGPNKKNWSAARTWEDKSSILAVNALLMHLVEKAITKQSIGGPPPPGTFAAGSGGGEGILQMYMPDDEPDHVPIDDPGGPLTRISLDPAEYAAVCLYQLDEYHRAVASALRRPRALGFLFDSSGVFRLRANTEEGGVYQVWRAPDLLPTTVPELDQELEAAGSETTFDILPSAGARQEFFWVSDLEE